MNDVDELDEQDVVRRALGRSVAVGFAVFVSVAATSFLVIAIPLFTLASFEPNGLDRPFIRTGLFGVAGPVGALVGMACGVVAGRWYRSGRRWRVDTGDDRYTTH